MLFRKDYIRELQKKTKMISYILNIQKIIKRENWLLDLVTINTGEEVLIFTGKICKIIKQNVISPLPFWFPSRFSLSFHNFL